MRRVHRHAARAAADAQPTPPRGATSLRPRRASPYDWMGGLTPVPTPLPGLMGDPGPTGRFGEFGGRFVPESLVPALHRARGGLPSRLGRPRLPPGALGHPRPTTAAGRRRSPSAARLSERLGVRVLLKREDLAHTGSHKLNNVVGQALLTARMGKRRLIAETGAGQHGVATATAAALLGLDCTVFMGEVDTQRQALNVFRMELLGARSTRCGPGSRTLKDAVNEALREWVATVDDTHYCLGSVMGPHPFPYMVRELQRVVGDEAREQCRELLGGADPDVVVACVGGGSNAAGTFAGFVDTPAPARRRRGGRRCGRDRRASPGSSTACTPTSSRTRRARSSRRLHLGRARLPGHRARARPPRPRSAGPSTGAPTDDEVLAGLRALGRDRGHHPRPRARPRPGVAGRRGRPGGPAGLDRARHPVGSRRQGRRPGPRRSSGRVAAERHRRPRRPGSSRRPSGRCGSAAASSSSPT